MVLSFLAKKYDSIIGGDYYGIFEKIINDISSTMDTDIHTCNNRTNNYILRIRDEMSLIFFIKKGDNNMTNEEKNKKMLVVMSEYMDLISDLEDTKYVFKGKDDEIYKEIEWIQQGFSNVVDDIFENSNVTGEEILGMVKYLYNRLERLNDRYSDSR